MENKIILYQNNTGKVTVNVLFQEENFWLTQKAMAELFGVDRSVITKHLKNIFETGELQENSVCANFAHTASGFAVSHLEAKLKAETEYEKYRVIQDKLYVSDFDEMVKGLKK